MSTNVIIDDGPVVIPDVLLRDSRIEPEMERMLIFDQTMMEITLFDLRVELSCH